jgi:uncharacterized protein (DUF2062 family)
MMCPETMPSSVLSETAPPVRHSFWRRRVRDPLIGQLKQGATPEKLAQSLAWGGLIGIFPILGTTTLLCGLAGVALRLNHIALQLVNWMSYPLQLALVIPFLRLGNLLFGMEQFPLSITEIAAAFEADFLAATRELGGVALRGIVAWALVALPAVALFRRALTPLLRRLAATLPARTRSTKP